MTVQAGAEANDGRVPIVYTIRGCDACVRLLKKLDSDGIVYDERRVELSQATLDEARQYGKLVPILLWPDGRVEQGFGDSLAASSERLLSRRNATPGLSS